MKIRSGGQTGVDRAALDSAIATNIPHCGWCPKGRRAENETVIPQIYNLVETESREFDVRTKLNIRDSDGTIIIVPSLPVKVTDGTILTIEEVKSQSKPYLIVSLSAQLNLDDILDWIKQHNIDDLNIAGPRESQAPGIYEASKKMLGVIFEALNKLSHRYEIPRSKL